MSQWQVVLTMVALISTGSLRSQTRALDPVVVLNVDALSLPTLIESPTLLLYSGGLFIRKIRDTVSFERPPHFVSKVLTSAQIESLVPDSDKSALFALDTLYDMNPQAFDQPYFSLQVWRSGQYHHVAVRGNLSQAPPAFVRLFDRLVHFQSPDMHPWLPDSIQIDLRIIDHDCGNPRLVTWPPHLPPPNHLQGRSLVRYFVPVSDLADLEDLLRVHSSSDCRPVVLDGRHWVLSYQYPFPSQDAWADR